MGNQVTGHVMDPVNLAAEEIGIWTHDLPTIEASQMPVYIEFRDRLSNWMSEKIQCSLSERCRMNLVRTSLL